MTGSRQLHSALQQAQLFRGDRKIWRSIMQEKMIRILLTAVMILAGILAGFGLVHRENKKVASAADVGRLTVDVLKVGKADAIILQCQDQTMVIDAAEEDDGGKIVSFLHRAGRTRVDTLLITHFDKDHVGGADTLVESMDIGRVLVPAYEGTTSEYYDFLEALQKKGLTAEPLTGPARFTLGAAQIVVEPPTEYVYNGNQEMDNNFSLITSVTHGDMRLLFTGDAMKARIREWLSSHRGDHYDLLKVPHHGVYNTAQEELAVSTSPRYAVICDSRKHPADRATIEALRKCGTSILQTKNGNIHAASDGASITIGQDLR